VGGRPVLLSSAQRDQVAGVVAWRAQPPARARGAATPARAGVGPRPSRL